jgi:signal transduction histidine kinase
VEIRIDNSDSVFHIFVADNYNGFNPDVLQNENGLRNMKMSAGRKGATLEIVSTGGCVITLRKKSS